MAKGGTLDLTIKIAGKLDKSLDTAINGAIKQTSLLSKSLQSIGTLGLAGFATITTGLTVGLTKSTEAAKDFESQMASVTKYVEGLADASGKVSDDSIAEWGDSRTSFDGNTYAENYDVMKDAILRLSTEIPYTAEELTKLAAAAGQSGYDIAELLAVDSNGSTFLKDVAMWGTAMDIDAEQAGDWAAKWEQAFDMTHSDVMELADQINYLGAHNATTAAEIATAVNSAASLGEVAGADVDTTAALATAMLSMGVSSDSVATSVKRMYTNISKGEAATSTQIKAFDMLGLSATQVAKDMQADATGTLLDIFTRIGNLDADRQVAALSSLFGQWAVEGGAKIAGNLELFRENLAAVSDSDLYSGSMEREFNIKSDTLEAADIMADNAAFAVMVATGDDFLGIQKSIAGIKNDFFMRLYDNLPELQTLANSVLPLIEQAMLGIADAIINALPYVQKLVDYIAEDPSGFLGKIGMFLGGSFALTKAPAIEGLVTSAGSGLLSAGGGILDTLFGSKTVKKGKVTRSGGVLNLLSNGFSKKGLTGKLGSFKDGADAISSGIGKYISNIANTDVAKGISAMGGVTGEILAGMAEATGLSSVPSLLGGALQGAGGFVSGKAGSALQFLGNTKIGQGVTGIAGAVGSKVDIFGGLKSLGGLAAGGIGSGAGFLSAIWSSPIGGFMSLFGSIAPIVGILGTVIALFSILGDKVGGVSGAFETVGVIFENVTGILREKVGAVFGETGIAIFDTFTDKLRDIGGVISGAFEEGGLFEEGGFISGLFGENGLSNALSGVTGFITEAFGPEAGEAFNNLLTIAQPFLGFLSQIVDFGVNTVKPMLLAVFEYISTTLIPNLLNAFNTVAPYIAAAVSSIGNAVMNGVQLIATVLQVVGPIIGTVITVLIGAFQVAAPAILTAITVISDGISGIIESIQTILGGVIEFVTGVFTGNWEQAWQGVQDIFGGIFSGLVALVKTPINAIVGLINSLIDGINGFVQGLSGNALADAVSSFVGVDLKNFQISHLPMLASGGFTSGMSIAGEDGQEAVISFDPAYRAANIATWLKAGELLGAIGNNNLVDLDEIGGTGRDSGGTADGTQTWNITYSPQITIQGSADKATLDKALSDAKAEFESWFYQMQKRQARIAY